MKRTLGVNMAARNHGLSKYCPLLAIAVTCGGSAGSGVRDVGMIFASEACTRGRVEPIGRARVTAIVSCSGA